MRLDFQLVDIMISPNATVGEAIECVNRSGGEIALVVGDDKRLLGTITDGDIRRGLLRGAQLAEPASTIMNASPRTARAFAPTSAARMQMELAQVRQLPMLDDEGRVVDLLLLEALLGERRSPNIVVLMAGGLGQRLRPLTEQVPKPMLPIGDKPILQAIIERFVEQGFYRFMISINYLGEVIEGHFGDGSRFGAEILYLRETKKLGTAGALSLLPFAPREPIFVMNGDILTSVDFNAMLRFHDLSKADATMGVNTFHFNVPFGVAEVSGERIQTLREKPRFDFFVNSGIYVLSPAALRHVPTDAAYDMPTLFEGVIAAGGAACAFPIHEHWFDIGRPDDLQRAQTEFGNILSAGRASARRAGNDFPR